MILDVHVCFDYQYVYQSMNKLASRCADMRLIVTKLNVQMVRKWHYRTSSETNRSHLLLEMLFMGFFSSSAITLMVSSSLILSICAVVGHYATASTQRYAFARDHGLPSWKQIPPITIYPRSCSTAHIDEFIHTQRYPCDEVQ